MNGFKLSISVSSSMKNSWNESLPTLATESSDVKANAETARLINVNTNRELRQLQHIVYIGIFIMKFTIQSVQRIAIILL